MRKKNATSLNVLSLLLSLRLCTEINLVVLMRMWLSFAVVGALDSRTSLFSCSSLAHPCKGVTPFPCWLFPPKESADTHSISYIHTHIYIYHIFILFYRILQSNDKLMPNSCLGQNLLVDHHGIAVSRNSCLSHAQILKHHGIAYVQEECLRWFPNFRHDFSSQLYRSICDQLFVRYNLHIYIIICIIYNLYFLCCEWR